jgi:hypothetical protein
MTCVRAQRELLKTALTLWATGEETVRARAFFVIRGLATSQRKLLPLAMKVMSGRSFPQRMRPL